MLDLPPEAASPIHGPYADCVAVTPGTGGNPSTWVAAWLVTAPRLHPVWSQWMLTAMTLADVAGVPAATILMAGATHEFGVLALNPEIPVSPTAVEAPDFKLPYLLPPNLVYQVAATDAEVIHVTALLALSIARGLKSPEPMFSNLALEGWAESITQTLAHLRGEEH